MRNNKAGFSLVELMVVVSIIAILASIAVPNFSKMSARAKQTSAKVELSGIYTAEQAWFSEYQEYHPNLAYIGYVPEAWATVTAAGATQGCPVVGGAGVGPQNTRYYRVGFIGIAAGAAAGQSDYSTPGGPSISAARGCTGTNNARTFYDETVAGNNPTWTLAASAGGATAAAAFTPGTNFIGVAEGFISQNGGSDVWNINQTKSLTNLRAGL